MDPNQYNWHAYYNSLQIYQIPNSNESYQIQGHYKQSVDLKKNGYTEIDVMVHTYSIWKEDEGSNFTLENAWRLLKNQPKRSDQIKETSSKRTKISTKGNYTPSSNSKKPIEAIESDTPSQIPRPMGQKSAKRKMKGKGATMSSPIVDLMSMEAVIREKSEATKKVVEAKVKEREKVLYEILMKDTSTISEEQHKKHEVSCSYILQKFTI
ncbi:hypothetical protein JHK82_035232 [Glycine max]|uniref:No apical meristem-associated C-terminal domain-containing protein n=1 Tax=Glycine max TaxID=3847 RepID=A0A0R0GI64_SOYBN|nr:hypothetical protein JHK85_035956 [Glycine max]KAG4975889.1 hypothetical protein JHK86_035363 [Glycine max]KAG5111963.1 hypothetical protein JHK82_035232 [Glycine max]KAG5129248.1 hypothetical protein JHK84_035645 [Glycine max]KAH1099735.1 hypothetical protein GYH30_035083 [Glycine max]